MQRILRIEWDGWMCSDSAVICEGGYSVAGWLFLLYIVLCCVVFADITVT
jgi:hypothetical protein